jgi:hypothetical protein
MNIGALMLKQVMSSHMTTKMFSYFKVTYFYAKFNSTRKPVFVSTYQITSSVFLQFLEALVSL